jgi:hypothetical protein
MGFVKTAIAEGGGSDAELVGGPAPRQEVVRAPSARTVEPRKEVDQMPNWWEGPRPVKK